MSIRTGLLCSRLPIIASLVVVVGMGTLTGCYDSVFMAPEGDLIAPYSIAYQGTSCESAGVKTVRAVLDNGTYIAEASCDAYEIQFEGVEPGAYELTVYGLNDRGKPVVDNLENGPVVVQIVADQEITVEEPIELKEAPEPMWLRWSLGFGNCKTRGIKYIQVVVVENGKKKLSERLKCNLGGKGEQEYRLVPDPKRVMIDATFDEIIVQPLANNGGELGQAFAVSFDQAYFDEWEDGAINMTLTCHPSGCFLPGEC